MPCTAQAVSRQSILDKQACTQSRTQLHSYTRLRSSRPGAVPLLSKGNFSSSNSSSSSSSSSNSSSSSRCSSNLHAAAWLPVAAVSALQHQQQRDRNVVTQAWFGQQQTQQLWDYDGSAVKQLSLRELELLHRLSFGHRNQRSYLVVLYTADSPACQAFEAEVERLASGLAHEPAFVAAALDVSGKEASTFVANMLNVDRVPAVLLYPEAARGCLKFLGPDMSALGMLEAINKARRKALPATASSPGAAEWRLIEAATPLPVTAFRAAAATGDTEAVVVALQQQMQPIQPSPLALQQTSSYWTAGRAQFWGGLLLCSLLFLAWDLKLSDLWEDWCLMRRQAARQKGRRFTAQENLDDVVTYMMKSLSGAGAPRQQEQGVMPAWPQQDPATQLPGYGGLQARTLEQNGDQTRRSGEPVGQQPGAQQARSTQLPQQQEQQLKTVAQPDVLVEQQGDVYILDQKSGQGSPVKPA